jgi:hypothetical protein
MYLNLLGTFAILVTCCMCGFVAYAFYFGCDPLAEGKITRHDQVSYMQSKNTQSNFEFKFTLNFT